MTCFRKPGCHLQAGGSLQIIVLFHYHFDHSECAALAAGVHVGGACGFGFDHAFFADGRDRGVGGLVSDADVDLDWLSRGWIAFTRELEGLARGQGDFVLLRLGYDGSEVPDLAARCRDVYYI